MATGGIRIHIDTTNIQRFAGVLRKAATKTGGFLGAHIRLVGKRQLDAAQRLAPGSMGQSLSLLGSGLNWRIESSHPAINYVRHGTPAHTIYPRFKKALYWPGAEHPVRVVHHPGAKPNDFVEKASLVAIGLGVLLSPEERLLLDRVDGEIVL